MWNRTFRAAPFAFAYAVPLLVPAATAWGRSTGFLDATMWIPLAVLFGLVPILDAIIGRNPHNPGHDDSLSDDWVFRALTFLCLPIHLGVLAYATALAASGVLSPVGFMGLVLSQGVASGVIAINVAHELIHKSTRLEPIVGGLLLASVGYQGFKVEHLRGHHVHVATPLDRSSAVLGQSVFSFIPKALIGNTVAAWALEARRLQALGVRQLSLRNEMLRWSLVWLGFGAASGWIFGASGLGFFVLQGLFAAASLEVINFIEHYGLARRPLGSGRYERVSRTHSWNADHRLSNWLLFNLQRHSDHHENPRRRYQALRSFAESPRLPAGYATMFVLALIPPLWRHVVDPRVAQALPSFADPG